MYDIYIYPFPIATLGALWTSSTVVGGTLHRLVPQCSAQACSRFVQSEKCVAVVIWAFFFAHLMAGILSLHVDSAHGCDPASSSLSCSEFTAVPVFSYPLHLFFLMLLPQHHPLFHPEQSPEFLNLHGMNPEMLKKVHRRQLSGARRKMAGRKLWLEMINRLLHQNSELW
ncbi:uncharacterized protein LOC127758250 isoform X2 [Oryza glaberrima]|uniref:uncharacterized protein LOC127758250 isoform X2 n=1 Tax=Oryza glaberrima TaxID=4538 RepID=UPI00224C0246|nr:uncharacterized protein LOC127758250 isoform X2 [Oryza glaberrima]